MSKLTKFFRHPVLYWKDYFRKRSSKAGTSKVVNPSVQGVGKVSSTINFSGVNIFREFSYYLHTGESLEAGANHLDLWLPLLLGFRIPFLLIVRNEKLYYWVIREYQNVDVVYAKGAGDVGKVVERFPYIRMALYPSSLGNNIHLVRFEDIRHCFIGHGDSDKASSAHKALRMFDEIWVAGQAHIDRFLNKSFNVSGLEFKKIGRPALKRIIDSGGRVRNDKSLGKVLYLPTWEGSNYKNDYSSVAISREIISFVSELALINVKFHPFTGHRDAGLKNIRDQATTAFRGNQQVSVTSISTPLLDIIENYDIFICDISSVVTECLALDAPILLYFPKDKVIELASSKMSFDDYCYVFSSVEELKLQIQEIISKGDPKADSRKAAVDYFIGLDETRGLRMKDLIKSGSLAV